MALPFVALLLLLVVQAALVARDQVLVVHAARSAVREASVGSDEARVVGAAQRIVAGADVHLERGDRVGDDVRIQIVHRSATDLPLIGPLLPDVVVTAAASMRLEREAG